MNEKVDPSCRTDSTFMSPSYCVTMFREIVNPIPRPPLSIYGLPAEELKLSLKSLPNSSRLIPIPVSSMATCSILPSDEETLPTLMMISPCCVYLYALLSRLMITCCSQSLSLYTLCGRRVAMHIRSSMCFSSINGRRTSTASCIASLMRKHAWRFEN